jgi:hypothetical protein
MLRASRYQYQRCCCCFHHADKTSLSVCLPLLLQFERGLICAAAATTTAAAAAAAAAAAG